MERGDRAPVATFETEELDPSVAHVRLGEDAAHHARVRRLSPGDAVRLTNGSGALVMGCIDRVSRAAVEVTVDHGSMVEVAAPPPVHLLVPVADRDRMLWLAEKCAELSLTTWAPVRYERSKSVSPRGEGDAFRDKVRRRMVAALEQSAGAWLPRIEAERDVATAALAFGECHRVLLDRDGPPLTRVLSAGVHRVAIALGPEGGLEDAERAELVRNGWRPAALAPSVLRFETAAVAAVAIARSLLLELSPSSSE